MLFKWNDNKTRNEVKILSQIEKINFTQNIDIRLYPFINHILLYILLSDSK